MTNREERGEVLLAQLEDLVLDVLRGAKRNQEILGPAEISRWAGIYLSESNRDRDWVGAGILQALRAKGQVSWLGPGRWELV